MRDIKFRALVDGVWIYSDDWTKNNGSKIINAKLVGSWISSFVEKCWFLDTRCEFTGLTDKNGVDIYEGDIVKARGTKRVGEYVTFVEYKHCGFQLNENKTYFLDNKTVGKLCEVIGNIHQNPELL